MAVAVASIREHSRRRLVVFFAAFSVLLTVFMIYLARNPNLRQILQDVQLSLAATTSLGFMYFLAMLATIAVSMNNIGQPFSDGQAMLILARPLSRAQYALGRLLGSVGVVVGLIALMALQMQVLLLIEGRGELTGQLWGHWGIALFNLSVLAAAATLLSTLIKAPVLVGIISFIGFQTLGTLGTLYRLAKAGIIPGFAAVAAKAAWLLTPKTLTSPLLASRISQVPVNGRIVQIGAANTPPLVLWAAGYLALIVAATLKLVERKEL
jgi:ABC-type transport system involved in multi-copper enzyme maturation permease subunit